MMERILPAHTPFTGIPYTGCAATTSVGSDLYPGTVTWVSPQTVLVDGVRMPKRIRVAPDDFRGVEGHNNAYTEDQRYEYYTKRERDDVEYGQEYSWRSRLHEYVRVGCSWRNGPIVSLGTRRAYRDPSF